MELCKEYKSMNCNEMTQKICESFDVDYQINLPQYLDDIEKLIKCCVKNVVCDYEFTGKEIKIFGKSVISLMYMTANGCPLSNEFEEEFTRSFALNDCDYFYFADIKLNTKYSNHRLINQRRIDVHSSIGAEINVYSKLSGKCLSSCQNAFVREEQCDSLSDKGAGVCSVEFDETFRAVKNDYQINNIVNAFLTSVIEDKKIIKDKMLVKIRNELSVIYASENGNLEKCCHSFSVSRIIEASECEEGDVAFITCDVSQLYVKARTDGDNMLNDIEAVGRLAISYKIVTIEEQSIVVDSYIPHFKSSTECKNMTLKSTPVLFTDEKMTELTLECDENIIEILDLKADVCDCRVENSTMFLNAVISAVYYDDASALSYLEKTLEFSFPLSDEALDGEGSANLKSYDFVIKNADRISLRINFEYSAFLYKTQKVSYITDILSDGERDDLNMPQLTLYFAKKDEKVWDIAKSFSTATSLIMEENDLKSEIIDGRRVLLVPGM